MTICMRDSGFEFKYQGEWYYAKNGCVQSFYKSTKENSCTEQNHDNSINCGSQPIKK